MVGVIAYITVVGDELKQKRRGSFLVNATDIHVRLERKEKLLFRRGKSERGNRCNTVCTDAFKSYTSGELELVIHLSEYYSFSYNF